MEQVVITSAGIITGAGTGLDAHHINLLDGGPEFKKLSEVIDFLPFSLDELHSSGAEVLVCAVEKSNAELAEMIDVAEKNFDRHQLFSLIAADEAMKNLEGLDVSEFACIGATGGAGLLDLFLSSKRLVGGKKLFPYANLKYLPNIFVGHLTQRYGLKGPSAVHGTACAASMHAMFDLVRRIQLGRVKSGLVVGAEAAISSFGIGSFMAQRALGNGLSYHKDRSGFVMGEGASALILESESSAIERGAEILGVVLGYGESSDGIQGGQITDPSPDGAARAALQALSDASINLASINLVKTHGTATPAGDLSELKSLQRLGSPEVVGLTQVMSMKSYFGHLLGAAGIAEIVAILSCMEHKDVLPTRGLKETGSVDPECDFVDHVREHDIQKLETVLCNGFGFGGTNASVVLGRSLN